jgi:Cytidylate kinase-like family
MDVRVICISASDGAHAGEVATAVGRALGFRVVDEEIVARAAAEAGVDLRTVADVEHRKTALMKILEHLVPSSGGDSVSPRSAEALITAGVTGVAFSVNSAPKRPSEELRGLIRSAIDEFMVMGDVVILMHAASQSLAGREHVLRVLVTASPPTRSARLSDALEVGAKEADAVVKKGDAARADYLKRFYGIENELPIHYDLVVNTDHLTPQEAAAAIVGLARPVHTPA